MKHVQSSHFVNKMSHLGEAQELYSKNCNIDVYHTQADRHDCKIQSLTGSAMITCFLSTKLEQHTEMQLSYMLCKLV